MTYRLRAVVKDWNERSIRLLLRLGFERTAEHRVGDTTYVVLERAVLASLERAAPVSP